MTEAEWHSCADPSAMMEHVRGLWLSGELSDRRVMLFAAAVVRLWGMMSSYDRFDSRALDKAEAYVDGPGRRRDLQNYWKDPIAPALNVVAYVTEIAREMNRCNALRSDHDAPDEVARVCGFFRGYFGDPLRPADSQPPAWGDAVTAFARSVYEDRVELVRVLDPVRLAALATMLEDAGCADRPLLDHLRGPGPHVRGCWSVDAVLGLR